MDDLKRPAQLDEPGYYGARDDQPLEQDYQLAGGALTVPKPRQTYWDKKTAYQQNDVSVVSCTVTAAEGAYTDMTGRVFDLPHRQAIWKIALQEGADPLVGWDISKAVNVVRKYANTLWGQENLSFRVEVGTLEFFEVLDKGYSVVTGFHGSNAYEIDRRDGVLDDVVFGRPAYGHAIRIVKDTDGKYTLIVDNYPKFSTWNTYKIDRTHFDKLLKNNVFFKGGYIFVDKEDWDKMNALGTVPIWAQKSVEKALEKKLILNTQTLDFPLTVGEIEDLMADTGIFQKKFGEITLVRLLVALDRLGRL